MRCESVGGSTVWILLWLKGRLRRKLRLDPEAGKSSCTRCSGGGNSDWAGVLVGVSCVRADEKGEGGLAFCWVVMKKKVDSRIRTLIENGVAQNHRTFIVLVGDKGKDQVRDGATM